MYCSRLRQNQNTTLSSHISSIIFTDLDILGVSKILGHILREIFTHQNKEKLLYKHISGNWSFLSFFDRLYSKILFIINYNRHKTLRINSKVPSLITIDFLHVINPRFTKNVQNILRFNVIILTPVLWIFYYFVQWTNKCTFNWRITILLLILIF
jgi:hypothetical protein